MEKPTPLINRRVLMTRDVDHYSVVELNEYSHLNIQPDLVEAQVEHHALIETLQDENVEVELVDSPYGCGDGIYVANWGVGVGNDIVVASHLPRPRKAEELYARDKFRELGKRVIVPPWQRFSGQGDALVIGDTIILGHGYRSDKEMEQFLTRKELKRLGIYYKIVSVQAVPLPDENGQPAINKISGWPDSLYYDVDIPVAILGPEAMAWCPEAFLPESQDKINDLDIPLKIEVSKAEVTGSFGCNVLSTGRTVIKQDGAPVFEAQLREHGFKIRNVKMTEHNKGGGSVRCSTNTLD